MESTKMKYIVDLDKGYCTCLAWRFQRRPTNARSCKHLLAASNGTFVPANPMAQQWEKVKPPDIMLLTNNPKVIKTGWWCSEKLDGVRGHWDGKGTMLTRGGLKVKLPPRILAQLPMGVPVDGEFWVKRQFPRSELLKIVENQSGNDYLWRNVRFMAFDSHQKNMSYKERYQYLTLQTNLNVIKTTTITASATPEKLLEKAVQVGAEGIVCRDPNAQYTCGRSKSVVKIKPSFFGIAKLLRRGGKENDLFEEISTGQEFKMRSAPSSISVGSEIKFKYRGRTETGKPLYPVNI